MQSSGVLSALGIERGHAGMVLSHLRGVIVLRRRQLALPTRKHSLAGSVLLCAARAFCLMRSTGLVEFGTLTLKITKPVCGGLSLITNRGDVSDQLPRCGRIA
jgi:hypothetical protein